MRQFRFLSMLVIWALAMLSGHLIFSWWLSADSWGYRFVYERGPVQWAILGVAVWAAICLYSHWREYGQQAARFRRFLNQQSTPPEPLAEVLRRAGRFWQEAGPSAVRSYIERFSAEQYEGVEKHYDHLRYLIGALPFLGLFGTVVGLTMALEQAFSAGGGNGAVEKFVAGLAVALDTTVLGMACAALLFAWFQWLMVRYRGLVEQMVQYLRGHFGLEDIPEQDKASYLIYRELCRVTKTIAEEAKTMYTDLAKETKSTFTELLTQSLEALRRVLGEAVQQHLAEHHQSQLAALETVGRETTQQLQQGFRQISAAASEQIRRSMEQHLRLVHQQNEALQQGQQAFFQQQTEALQQHWQAQTERLERQAAQSAEAFAAVFHPSVSALQEAILRQAEQWPGRVEAAAAALVSALRPVVAELIQQTTQNAHQFHTTLADRLSAHMTRLEKAIHHRTPEEILIRYRDGKYVSQESDQCPVTLMV